jgi:fucose permease
MPIFIAVVATFLQQSLTYMSHLVVPIAAPELSRIFDLPVALAGAHMGIVYLVASVSMVFAGGFIRRFGAARMSQVALLATAIGLALGAAGALWAFALSAFLIGAGSAFSTPASSDILARYAPPKHAPLIFSIKQTGVPAGGMLGGILVPFLINGWDWQVMFLTLGGSCLALAIAFQAVRKRFDVNRNPNHRINFTQGYYTLRGVLVPRPFRYLVYATFTFCGLQGVFGAFFVSYLVEGLGMTLAAAGGTFAFAQAASIAFRIAWGGMAGAWGARPVLAILGISMSFIAVACGFMNTAWPHWSVTAIAIAYSATAISWHGVVLAEIANLSKTGETATNTGGVLAFATGGQTAYPALFGLLLATTGSFGLGFILAGPPALLVGLLFLLGYRRDIAVENQGM